MRNACKEDKGGNEETDAEVEVDGGSWTLDGADQWERQDAEEEANQWKGQTQPGDQLQLKPVLLREGLHYGRNNWDF